MVQKFEAQGEAAGEDPIEEVIVECDTDHAGCLRTRKSTTAGVIMFGNHFIKNWSITQGAIALSSGESEYYGIVKGGSVGLGMRGLYEDLGVKVRIRVKTDASAAKGIASRKGVGRARHIEVNQ